MRDTGVLMQWRLRRQDLQSECRLLTHEFARYRRREPEASLQCVRNLDQCDRRVECLSHLLQPGPRSPAKQKRANRTPARELRSNEPDHLRSHGVLESEYAHPFVVTRTRA